MPEEVSEDAAAGAVEWTPANGVERALLAARLRDDPHTLLEVVGRATLYLPTAGTGPAGEQRYPLWVEGGTKHLVAFTSLESLSVVLGADAAPEAVITSYAQLRAKWPDPRWEFALNPNLPISLASHIEKISELLDPDSRVRNLGEAVAATEAVAAETNETEALARAVASGDADRVLLALLGVGLYVPVAAPVDTDAEIDWAAFPWWSRRDKTGTHLPAFGAPEQAAGVLPPDVMLARVPLRAVAEHWPDDIDRLVVDFGGGQPIILASDVMVGMLFAEQDLRGGGRAGESRLLAGVLDTPAAPTTPAATDQPPTLVLKVLPAAFVDRYLKNGYNRVSGFAYPAEPLVDLATPAELYEALGLGPDAGPFDPAAPAYLLRWYAYLPELYPVAYGGRSEETLRLLGGWIIEPEPFVGAGVAPGPIAVPELKVDGLVLPHGAELVRLEPSGRERVMATYDADFRWWVTEHATNIADLMRQA